MSVEYIVKDQFGHIQARLTMKPSEVGDEDDAPRVPVLPPMFVHNIQNTGWVLERWETPLAGITVQTHGTADWKDVADSLSAALKDAVLQIEPFSSEEFDSFTDEEKEFHRAREKRLREAMDAYDLASFEVMVINPQGVEPERNKPEEG